jgi:hypothetical protein
MRRTKAGGGLLILALIIRVVGGVRAPVTAAGGPPNPIYVDQSATGADTGETWADAKTELQDALALSLSGVEIWVAEGVYKPTTTAEREAAFALKDGVALYGGFPTGGGDGTFGARDWETHPTILSGDIGTPGVATDNVYHVVTGSGALTTTVLNGFVVTGGYANGAEGAESVGGGMYSFHGQSTIANVTFVDNFASTKGGGMYNVESSPTLMGVTFTANEADEQGGAMCNFFQSNPKLVDVSFYSNTAGTLGGAVYNDFSGFDLSQGTFTGNTASRGGAMYNAASDVGLDDVTFEDNSADYEGGGMVNSNSSAQITGVAFFGNRARVQTMGKTYGDGGALSNQGSSPELLNVLFSGNDAGYAGGALYNDDHSSPTVINATFGNNSAEVFGMAVYNRVSSNPVLINCVFWDDQDVTPEPPIENSSSSPTFSHCDVQGSGGSADWNSSYGTDVGHNVDLDPEFLDTDGADELVGTEDDDLRPAGSSPVIDAGHNQAVPPWITTDLAGNARFVDNPTVPDTGTGTAPIVDMGAYEFANHAPTISDIPDQVTYPGIPIGPILFTIGDVETPATELTVSAKSLNTTLVPTGDVVFGGTGSLRTVFVTPASGETGTALVTIIVDDGTDRATDDMLVTVTPYCAYLPVAVRNY